MPELRKKYPFDVIEPKWQQHWLAHKTFAAHEDATKPKLYVLDMFPYPSGAGLHVGHPEGYTATDIYCRFKRMRGFNVLHPMGWDAFGLPAEQYAIDTGTHPSITTKKNVDTFRRQIQMLGFSYDWDREVDTTDPHYFKWTQWIFLQLFNAYYDRHLGKAQPISILEDALSDIPSHESLWSGNPYLKKIRQLLPSSDPQRRANTRRQFLTNLRLAGEGEVPVWWCDGCKAVLANEEVNADGTCDRKGHKEVYRRPLRQWILRITAYAERLLTDLEHVNWPHSIKEQQRNWIGRSEGATVQFVSENGLATIRVYTTRPDTLFGATYMVLAPEHSQVDLVTTAAQKSAVDAYRAAAGKKSELERGMADKEKTGVFTGGYAINPVNDEKIPVWIADYVMMGYGTGAIMAVPAHDTRDFEFAKKFGLEIREVVAPAEADGRARSPSAPRTTNDGGGVGDTALPTAFVEEGISIDSGLITGLPTPEAKKKITAWLGEKGVGEFAVNYKLRDWLFSRQRYWGEPIPIVHCGKCGTVPVPESELPLRLPEMKDYSPSGNAEPPLAKAKDWVNCKCPHCGGPGERETNTMPQWAGSCWYYLRYVDPHNAAAFVAKDKEKYWMPVDLYVGGAEHAVLHLLYSRFWHKVLFDLGHVSTPEPFHRLVNQGMILGEDNQKMSKSRGNVINPDAVVADYGADTLRLYEMFMGPLEATKPWSMEGVQGIYRFLGRVWRLYCDEDGKLLVSADVTGSGTPSRSAAVDPRLLKVLHQTIKKVGEDTEALAFNTAISQMMIFVNELTAQESRPRVLLEPFVLVLAPYAPHLAEELWAKLGHAKSLTYEPFPAYDASLLIESTVQIVVQVNGKVRARLDIPAGLAKDELEKQALAHPEVQTFLAGKQVRKVITVPGKLVNIAVG